MRISDWSSDVCSSDLFGSAGSQSPQTPSMRGTPGEAPQPRIVTFIGAPASGASGRPTVGNRLARYLVEQAQEVLRRLLGDFAHAHRSEEHTSELQSLMRISYAVFCLKKKNNIVHALTASTYLFTHQHY